MIYSATVEWLCFQVAIIRIHEGAGASLGDPYVWCATVFRGKWDGSILRGAAYVKGVDKRMPKGGARPFLDALRTAGFRCRVHERIKGGKVRRVVKNL